MRRRPPFDPDLARELSTGTAAAYPVSITPSMLPLVQAAPSAVDVDALLEPFPDVVHEERRIPGAPGGPDLCVSILRRSVRTIQGPGVLYVHGGGMFSGSRLDCVSCVLGVIERFDGVVVSVDYRLAPQHPDPAPVEDCYAALRWMASRADELGYDPRRLVVVGVSAGGGLAAGTVLLARDRGGPQLAGQVLVCPMLDDRNASTSSEQMAGVGIWDRISNATGWGALLGDRAGGPDVSIYAAPARATDLSDLPPTFIDVGSAETFRDEAVAFASALWADGVDTELHVHAGGFHGFEFIAPDTAIAAHAAQARDAWLGRLLSR